ncbi:MULTISPECIES: hypothetical protein [Staphylococcus]|nr:MULTISPECIES: hypothetical protein [Staphylococcus]KIJ87134.1 hypothetical protein SE00_05655 [Staphylococcus saprophyticus]MBF2779940.1 hypothetical protein [Staphylococcus saprophyticus]MBN6092598.1 hypothetical protein [Staphylococcus saprophyticus]MBN6095059.1 hypothetical protein [Staphylococcus saprophyticus]MBN6096155.1 hypothetical protein [Staphylococcus saprophyticus]
MSILKMILYVALLVSFCILMFQSIYFVLVFWKLKNKKISEYDYEQYKQKYEKPMFINLGVLMAVTALFNLLE